MTFDLASPGVESIPCHTFGGGWAFPLTPDGQQALEEYFGGRPAPIAPHGGRRGYIVEPQDGGTLAEYLQSVGVSQPYDPSLWRPATNGAFKGRFRWGVARYNGREWADGAAGRTIRLASYESAERLALRLNERAVK